MEKLVEMIKEYVYKTLNVSFVGAYSNEFSVQGYDRFVAGFVEHHTLQCGGKKKGLVVPPHIFVDRIVFASK